MSQQHLKMLWCCFCFWYFFLSMVDGCTMTQREALRELQLKSTTVSPAQLKAAYRKRSLETHPDKPGGSAEAFVRVHQAYECLNQKKQNDGDGQRPPSSSTEEQMKYASEFFFREFAEFLDNSDTAVDSFVDNVFDAWNDGKKPSFSSRQAKRIAKWLARNAMSLFKNVLEMENLEITINGQKMTASELKTIREILRKQQRPKETLHNKETGAKDDL